MIGYRQNGITPHLIRHIDLASILGANFGTTRDQDLEDRRAMEGKSMFIQTETTSNPATLKFLPGKAVMQAGSAAFANAENAEKSPLAKRLFEIDGVVRVLLEAESISLNKADDKDWDILKPAILGAIMDHYTSGDPVLIREQSNTGSDDTNEDAGDIGLWDSCWTGVVCTPAIPRVGEEIDITGGHTADWDGRVIVKEVIYRLQNGVLMPQLECAVKIYPPNERINASLVRAWTSFKDFEQWLDDVERELKKRGFRSY